MGFLALSGGLVRGTEGAEMERLSMHLVDEPRVI